MKELRRAARLFSEIGGDEGATRCSQKSEACAVVKTGRVLSDRQAWEGIDDT
jgi:hypothetical protein